MTEDNNLTADTLIISALLHDIGKFTQRAKQEKDINLENSYCPVYNGNYSHKHVLYSSHFLSSPYFSLPSELARYRDTISKYASSHHVGGNLIESIIQRADCLSSGLDRRESEECVQNDTSYDNAHFQSIFTQIKLDRGEVQKSYQRLLPLDEYKNIFPIENNKTEKDDYKKLFIKFREELQTLPLEEGNYNYISSLVSLLEKYTHCIPSCT